MEGGREGERERERERERESSKCEAHSRRVNRKAMLLRHLYCWSLTMQKSEEKQSAWDGVKTIHSVQQDRSSNSLIQPWRCIKLTTDDEVESGFSGRYGGKILDRTATVGNSPLGCFDGQQTNSP